MVRLDRKGGHTELGGEGADTFNFYAPSARPCSGTIMDFNASEDTFVIDGQDGFGRLTLTPHALLETKIGITVSLMGGGRITFEGHCADQLQALIPDALTG